MWFEREQVVPWGKAADGGDAAANFSPAWAALPVSLALTLAPAVAQAATSDRIVKAFRPLIDLVQGIRYPIAFLGLSSGFLLYMTGNRERGLQLIKSAAIGYIGLQFVPALMSLLVDVGKAMIAP